MRDVVGIPSFGEHWDRYDATDIRTELARFSHGVHDLAQHLFILDVVNALLTSSALDSLTTKPFNLWSEQLAEARINRLSGFNLLRVNQQRIHVGERIPVVVKVSKQLAAAVL
jgi:hypothetical protein